MTKTMIFAAALLIAAGFSSSASAGGCCDGIPAPENRFGDPVLRRANQPLKRKPRHQRTPKKPLTQKPRLRQSLPPLVKRNSPHPQRKAAKRPPLLLKARLPPLKTLSSRNNPFDISIEKGRLATGGLFICFGFLFKAPA
jgi:hypothetical protein